MSAPSPEVARRPRRAGPRQIVAAALLAGLAAPPAAADPAPPLVTVVRVAQGCVSHLVTATGIIVPRAVAVAVAGVAGLRVAEVSAHQGDLVKAGQVLAQFAPKDEPAGAAQPLRAPAAGLVIRETATVGLIPEPAAPLFSIAVDGEMEMLAEIFAAHVPELNAGQGSRVRLEDKRDLVAHVRLVPAEIDRSTQRGEARLSLDGGAPLVAGAVASAWIETRRACGITVPRSALVGREVPGVRVVRGGAVEFRRVKTGLLTDDAAEVLDGLTEGESVVAQGGVELAPGAAVRAAENREAR